MNINELKSLLSSYSELYFRIKLPGGGAVPLSFHVTEVGHVHKTFLDCGGKRRERQSCQLQIWVGQDYDHRIETGKMAAILEKAGELLPDDNLPVEIEYEDQVISQYTISGHSVEADAVILELAHKHTECLAPELCGLPPLPGAAASERKEASCCGPSGCC
ncbi:MAG: DUF6428 family protein [Akkermansiaceae bacterium]